MIQDKERKIELGECELFEVRWRESQQIEPQPKAKELEAHRFGVYLDLLSISGIMTEITP